jgi:hypothetical protein
MRLPLTNPKMNPATPPLIVPINTIGTPKLRVSKVKKGQINIRAYMPPYATPAAAQYVDILETIPIVSLESIAVRPV